MNASFEELLGPVRVIPVISIADVESAVPLARALVAGGLSLLEVTLRTPAALESIARIAAEVDGAVVGAGTVVTAPQFDDAAAAGARFVVSPGCTDALLDAALGNSSADRPVFLPGAVTPSEVMRLLDAGITTMKFFPAAANGGVAALKALAGPFPQVRFCPTGGVSPDNACDYLALPNVVCVGGTWMLPSDAIAAGAWDTIRGLADSSQVLADNAVASG